MSNLFTQQQHSFYSKENNGIGYFGPKPDQEGKTGGKSDCGGNNKGAALPITIGHFNSASSNQNEPPMEQMLINDDS